jgi:hypothetical protein
MEAITLILGIVLPALLLGALVYLPFWLLGRACINAGKALQKRGQSAVSQEAVDPR